MSTTPEERAQLDTRVLAVTSPKHCKKFSDIQYSLNSCVGVEPVNFRRIDQALQRLKRKGLVLFRKGTGGGWIRTEKRRG